MVEFDPAKSRRNIAERGLSFELAERMDWENALFLEDRRYDYGERRYVVLGMLTDQLLAAVVTPRNDDLRVISLRRANRKERRVYEQEVGRGGGRAP